MSLWLKGLVIYLITVSVITQMLPNEKYENYVRLFTGFLLILLLLQPILKIRSLDTFLEKRIMEFVQEQETLEAQIRLQGETFREQSIQDESASENADILIPVIDEIKVEVMAGD